MINPHQILQFVRHFFSAKRNGHGIHSPYAYALCEEVFYNEHSFYDFELLKKIREELMRNSLEVETGGFGAGSKTFQSNKRKVKDIAQRGISSFKQSELLYKLVNYLTCNTCIELGTSLGLITVYLAKANTSGRVISVEGSEALFNLAKGLARESDTNNIQFINADFDTALPELLNEFEKIDFLYIDGNHTYEATWRYFLLALPKLHPGSVVIFDDIYWSEGMTEVWKKIKGHPSVTLSIDTFYLGLIFFREELKEKTDLKIYL